MVVDLLFASRQVNIGQGLPYARLKQLADETKERAPDQQCELRSGCKLFDALPSEMGHGKRTCVKDCCHKTFELSILRPPTQFFL
jgi:hypothetical protein